MIASLECARERKAKKKKKKKFIGGARCQNHELQCFKVTDIEGAAMEHPLARGGVLLEITFESLDDQKSWEKKLKKQKIMETYDSVCSKM